MLGTTHWIGAALALVAGGLQLAGPKGTRARRRLGWAGAWNQFHTLAVISLTTLLLAVGGFVVVGASSGSYLGVVMAGLLQLATHLPVRTEAVRAAWLIAIALAAWLFLRKVPRDVAGARPIATAQ